MTETIIEQVPQGSEAPRRNDLSRMLMPELKELAHSMGISGVSGMRKPDLLAAIRNRQTGQRPPGEPAGSATQSESAVVSGSSPTGSADSRGPGSGGSEAAAQGVGQERSEHLHGGHGDGRDRLAPDSTEAAERTAGERSAEERSAAEPAAPVRAGDQEPHRRSGSEGAAARGGGQRRQDRPASGANANGSGDHPGQGAGAGQPAQDQGAAAESATGRQESREDRGDEGDRGDRNRRRNRDRNRGRERNPRDNRDGRGERGGRGEQQVSEDDVLIPVAGIIDILENYAFVRTTGYLPGPNDLYVSMSMVKRNRLRKGDTITGAIKQPEEATGGRREKYNPLARIDTVNGTPVDQLGERPEFGKLTPLYPQQRLRLETEANNLTTRIIDLVAPIGKGQRGLIVSPPKAGKTMVLQSIANAITTNNPECHLMVVLVDERPEEVTDMQRSVKGEVIASTFDRPAEDHTTVAELAIERAKRLVEMGYDVVVLLDSMTRLGRAYNLSAPASGRILSGGVDSAALYPPKKFFGAARNIENGGSLTILATALVETGSKMDEVIFEEFKGTGNMELKLDRRLADKRIFPAVDVDASGTRKEELLMAPDELKTVWKLRRVLHALDSLQAIELLVSKLKETQRNYEFMLQVQKNTPTHDHLD